MGMNLPMRLIAGLALGALVQCTSPEKTPDEKKAPAVEDTKMPATHVVVKETPYYETGPQQGRPPEGSLKEGTKLRVTGDMGAYVQVETQDGVHGWVSSDSVKKL